MLEDPSHAFLDWKSLLNTPNPSLFFGVGLCTSKQPAVAIPFDILSFFFLAEKLRRALDLNQIFVLIADTHALTNSFMDPKSVDLMTRKMKRLFTSIIRNLHLANFQILTSSRIHQDPQFQNICNSIPTMENEYVRQEIADMFWFCKEKNVRLKLGWAIDHNVNQAGHDERFFDQQIQQKSNIDLSFIHTKAGRTFDPKRPKVSPYISVAGENRLILDQAENVQNKINLAKQTGSMDVVNGVRIHTQAIVRLFESLFINIPLTTLEEKLQFIINLATKNL